MTFPARKTRMGARSRAAIAMAAMAGLLLTVGLARAAGIGPIEGGALPAPLPLFPSDNWWNLDIRQAPTDPASSSFIAFINNGGARALHPDFGGDVSPGSVAIYGFPYAVVDGTQTKLPVTFQYSDESDGVDHATNQPYPFYPIPSEAITQPHWVEGGSPGNVDQRSSQDRHLLIVDRDHRSLYELYNVWFDGSQWRAGSGAFFDMNTDGRRPDGRTSADAAGLAVLPGLARYDEVYEQTAEIGHALRVTVRATNGYVFPASHRAGSTAGALPMGARLRLKAGKDISGFAPEMQRIFRAMKTYGLIVADNGSDMYVSGTYDVRWNNDVLNPAFGALSASDFEVVELGWNPAPFAASLSAVSVFPASLVGGASTTGTASLSAAAPTGGVLVSLGSSSSSVSVPASVTVPGGSLSATFPVSTTAVTSASTVTISGVYGGITKTAVLTVNPQPPPPPVTLSSLVLSPTTVTAGSAATGTVKLSGAAPSGGASVTLSSSNKTLAAVPSSILVPAGSATATFTISTNASANKTTVTISARLSGSAVSAKLGIQKKHP